jgi:hypothetical protein
MAKAGQLFLCVKQKKQEYHTKLIGKKQRKVTPGRHTWTEPNSTRICPANPKGQMQ